MNRAPAGGAGRSLGTTIAILALVVAACGSTTPEPVATAAPTAAPTSASPSASPSVAPSAAASPSSGPSASPSAAADTGAALVGKLTAFTFAAKTTIAGEYLIPGARYAVGGTFDVSGVDHHTVLSVLAPGRQTVESVYKAGVLYQRIGTGPWYAKPPTLHDSDLSGFFRSVKAVTDAGVETKNGKALHHLTLPASTTLSPTVFGLADASMTGVSGTVEFWAEDDGTPGVMAVHDTWQGTVSGKSVDQEMTIEFTFTEVNTSLTIAEPEDIWTTYTSKQFHMSYGYPIDWYLYKNQKDGTFKYDQVAGPDAAYADLSRYASHGATPTQLVAYLKTNPDKVKGFHVNSVKSVKMGGLPARQMRIHATVKGKKRYWLLTFALKGSYYYEIDLFDDKGHEADDVKLMTEFLATIVIK